MIDRVDRLRSLSLLPHPKEPCPQGWKKETAPVDLQSSPKWHHHDANVFTEQDILL